MSKRPILDEVHEVTRDFAAVRPRERTKLTGALATEVIRRHLLDAGVPVSPRDVYMRGNPTEFDTLIVRPSARPECGIVYDPLDVAAALEVKFSGVYSQDVPAALKALFERIRAKHPHIQCVYVTVCENPRFKFRITTERLGFPAFTLYWVNRKRTIADPGDSLQSVVACLKKAVQSLPKRPSLTN